MNELPRYSRLAIAHLGASGERSIARLDALVEHFCRVYGVENIAAVQAQTRSYAARHVLNFETESEHTRTNL